jgi:hypothetical protein
VGPVFAPADRGDTKREVMGSPQDAGEDDWLAPVVRLHDTSYQSVA